MQSTDNAIVNIPLAKRGNIDAQLDAYKAQQAALATIARKAAAQAHRTAKAAAKVALAALLADPELIAAKAARVGGTPRELAAMLTDWSKWEPAKLLKAHAEWMPA
jgi:hypothetical protein